MQNTTNYQLPKYTGTDPVNLLTGYNPAGSDPVLTVTQLSTLKVATNGIVYVPSGE